MILTLNDSVYATLCTKRAKTTEYSLRYCNYEAEDFTAKKDVYICFSPSKGRARARARVLAVASRIPALLYLLPQPMVPWKAGEKVS